MRRFPKASIVLTVSALLIGSSAAATAQTWLETLPPQTIVNASLASQDTRMDGRAEDGARVHHEESQVGHERETASRSARRIDMEDSTLNRPENAISPQLRRE